MAVAFHHKHVLTSGAHRIWPIVGAVIAFLLAMFWASPIG